MGPITRRGLIGGIFGGIANAYIVSPTVGFITFGVLLVIGICIDAVEDSSGSSRSKHPKKISGKRYRNVSEPPRLQNSSNQAIHDLFEGMQQKEAKRKRRHRFKRILQYFKNLNTKGD